MWNRFLPKSSSFRARLFGASLTLVSSAVLAMSCSAGGERGFSPAAGGGSGNSPGKGGANGTAGGPAQCATMCNGVCVYTTQNVANCGSCGHACTADAPYCVASMCSSNCPAPNLTCGAACVNPATDLNNCGGCNKPCSAGQMCSNSTCVAIVSGAGGAVGAGGTSGVAGGSSTAGSGGGGVVVPPNRNGCQAKAGMISDFEEGAAVMDPVVIANEGRSGTWGIFNDASKMTQKMTVEASGGTADCDKFALHVTGSGYNDYVGFGMNFAGTADAPTVYDAGAKNFTGIRFKAKAGSGADAKSPIRFNLSTPFTEDSSNPGGACKTLAKTTEKAERGCYQHVGEFISPGTGANQLTSSFKTFTFCFDKDLYPLSLPSNLSNAQRDATAANLLKLQFQFNQGKDYSGSYQKAGYPPFGKGLAFDFWVDDVEFVTGDCTSSAMAPSPSNGSPAKPFPQNAAVGTCAPATNAAKLNNAIAQIYQTWTQNFVQTDHIVAPEQNNDVTSEAMGYGMLISAAIGDKTAFDKFAGYVSGKLSGGLMTWKNGQSGSASDADLDIAYAYLIANLQWPSGGYKAKSDAMATAIANTSNGDLVNNIVSGGSSFHSAPFNPSYFAPAWMRKLSGLSGAVGANYTLVNSNVSATSTGIPTDWANMSDGKPSGPGSAQVTSEIQDAGGAMGYDAARVPWRLGMDACLGGSDTTALKSIVSFFAAKYDAGATIDLLKAGWIKSSGAVHPKAIDMQGSYIGPMGVGGMATGNTAMRDRAFRAMLDMLHDGDYNHTYFPSTVGLLSLLALSGNFPTP
jgi:endo-1,4-beta-D-glucanase Y